MKLIIAKQIKKQALDRRRQFEEVKALYQLGEGLESMMCIYNCENCQKIYNREVRQYKRASADFKKKWRKQNEETNIP
jgi:hypothetical protein